MCSLTKSIWELLLPAQGIQSLYIFFKNNVNNLGMHFVECKYFNLILKMRIVEFFSVLNLFYSVVF